MPPLYPVATAMAFELAAYGALSGMLYKMLPKSVPNLYISLLAAMAGGRLVWGAAQLVLLGIKGNPFTLAAFWSGSVANAIPGIILQIVLVPILVLALRRAKLSPNE